MAKAEGPPGTTPRYFKESFVKPMKNPNETTRDSAGRSGGWRRLAFCLFVLTAATTAFAGAKFSSIVVFGDSLSDTGRLFRLTHGAFPPRVAYFEGRQSNGPVWVEYLADALDSRCLKNYAVVGAMTGPSAAVPAGNVKSDTYAGLEGTSLRGQLAMYLANTGGRVDPQALYVVEGGANDLIRPLSALLMNPPATNEEFLQAVNEIAMPTVVNTATIVGTLKALGAQHIAVVNVPDFGKSPYLLGFGPVASYIVSSVVDQVNDAVASQLDAIDAAGGRKLARIDAYGFIDGVAAAPATYGFTNVTGEFMTLDMASGTVTFAAPHRHAAAQWFFWDDLHPTTRGHRFFAENALASVKSAFPEIFAGHCGDGGGHR